MRVHRIFHRHKPTANAESGSHLLFLSLTSPPAVTVAVHSLKCKIYVENDHANPCTFRPCMFPQTPKRKVRAVPHTSYRKAAAKAVTTPMPSSWTPTDALNPRDTGRSAVAGGAKG